MIRLRIQTTPEERDTQPWLLVQSLKYHPAQDRRPRLFPARPLPDFLAPGVRYLSDQIDLGMDEEHRRLLAKARLHPVDALNAG